MYVFFVSVRFFRSTGSRWKTRMLTIRQNAKRKSPKIGVRQEQSYQNEKNVHDEREIRRKSYRTEKNVHWVTQPGCLTHFRKANEANEEYPLWLARFKELRQNVGQAAQVA